MATIQYHNLLLVLVAALLLCIARSSTNAQETLDNNKPDRFWLNAGIGGGPLGFSAGASLCYKHENSIVSIRHVHNRELRLSLFDSTPSESVWDLGVLYGRIAEASYGTASISGGIAIVRGVRRGRSSRDRGWFATTKYEMDSFSAVGIPIEGQLFLTPHSWLGIGLVGFANVNQERSFGGALLCIRVGNLK
jgi:hypothetical protein